MHVLGEREESCILASTMDVSTMQKALKYLLKTFFS